MKHSRRDSDDLPWQEVAMAQRSDVMIELTKPIVARSLTKTAAAALSRVTERESVIWWRARSIGSASTA